MRLAVAGNNENTTPSFSITSGFSGLCRFVLTILDERSNSADSRIECINCVNTTPVITMLGDSMRSQRTDNLKKLDRFSEYPENWNGYGSVRFSPEVISFARKLIDTLICQPEVFPVANGTIQMEYEKSTGEYLEFVVEIDRSISVFHIDENGNETEGILPKGDIDSAIEKLNLMVKRIYG